MTDLRQTSRVRVIGGCDPDELLLLRTQIGRLPGMWSIVESADANLVLCNLDTESGQAAWTAHDEDDRTVAYVALFTGPAPSEARFSIERPLRALALTEVLQRARGELQPAEGREPRKIVISSLSARASTPSDVPSLGDHDPEDLLLGLLRSLSGNDPIAIGPTDTPAIILRPDAGVAWSEDWQNLIALARTPKSDIRYETIRWPEFGEDPSRALVDRRLDELMWFAALEGSQGRPLRELKIDQGIRLKAFPDFQRLYRRPVHVRIAYVMSRGWLRVEQIAEAARASVFEVTGLCNGCACLDLLEFNATAALHSGVPRKRSQLFQRIFDRLAQARGGAA